MALQHRDSLGGDNPTHEPRIPKPPFNAGALRLSALDHLKSYEEFNEQESAVSDKHLLPPPGPEGDYDSRSLIRRSQAATWNSGNEETLLRYKTIRGLLLIDLKRILQAADHLAKTLEGERLRAWLVPGAIAASTQLISSTSPISSISSLPVAVATLPIAVYCVARFEYQMYSITTLRGEAESLQRKIEGGEDVYNEDLEWLVEKSRWSEIPWDKIEPDII